MDKDFVIDMLEKRIHELEDDIEILRKAKDRDAIKLSGNGEFKGTVIGDPVAGETLYFHPSYHSEVSFATEKIKINTQVISIANVAGMVYFCGYQSCASKTFNTRITEFWLTREEVMIIIKGLVEAIAKIERGEE